MNYSILRKEISEYSDEHLANVWESLREYNPKECHTSGITMDEWAEMIYFEVTSRREKIFRRNLSSC